MEVDMSLPTFDGVPFLGMGVFGSPTGAGSGPGIGGAGGGGPAASSPDHDIADMKMAVRLDDHVEGIMAWMLCDGRALDRLVYATLFARIGVAYGPGDGLTTFNIPLFTSSVVPGSPPGRFPVGATGGFGYMPGMVAGMARHLHGLSWVLPPAPISHTYNPDSLIVPTVAGGLDPGGAVPTAPLHAHMAPEVYHDAPPPETDALVADVVPPYVAVGFFVRVS